MVYFPVRKCYYIAKVSLLIILVVTVLALFEKWRGGKRAASAFLSPQEEEYEREILADEAKIIPGLGEGGAAAYLTGEDKKRGEESEKNLAMNVYLSDRIAYNRTLTDERNPACARVVYDAELPSASVILIFHNEPYSVVVRTIWSVINSCRRDQPWFSKANFVDRDGRTMKLGYPGQDPASPLVYLKEIILVDDNSTMPELKGKLSHYVRTRCPPDLIRILRLPDRVGLTRARLAGARYATGSVLVFLDAHCEAQPDWLRPQLQVIKDSPHAVVIPIIDSIDHDNFYYSVQDTNTFQGLMIARIRGARAARGDVLIFLDAHCEAQADWMRPLLQRIREKRDTVVTPVIDVLDQSSFKLESAEVFQVGGFTFTGHFTWIDVPEREKIRRGSDIAPTWSPTMAGGLFAINRAYYWELGAYDEQMAGWGGENLEMSFRIWQCGGTLETVPCSRVGHVFRSFHPYSMPANTDTHGINTARMAEVWMDEYAELFYLHRPDLRKNPKIGDVTHRKVLREKLQCKSFQWFLDNVYKEKYVPVRDAFGYGRFRNPSSGLCIDNLQREGDEAPLGVYTCHPALQPTQFFSLSLAHELRDEDSCAQLQYKRHVSDDDDEHGRKIFMSNCHGKLREQKWKYLPHTKQIQHSESQLCLDAGTDSGQDLLAKPCSDALTQQWHIDYTEDNNFKLSDEGESTEQEMRLQRLRGQRRKSRSLLSIKTEKDERRRHRKHRKKNKTKNKFILKLARTLMNGTEDHLEMDIYCKHRQLYPNNTFVRDLVTILNERNIKVINNGRVFERNKVTQLDPKLDEQRKVLNKMDIEPLDEEIQQMRKPKLRKRKHKPSAPNNKGEPTQTNTNTHQHSYTNIHNAITNANEAFQTIVPVNERLYANELMNENERNETETNSPRSHRIIIEDFIQMTPSSSAINKHTKRRKHKRQTTSAPREQNILSIITQKLSDAVEQYHVPQSEEHKDLESPMLSASETADTHRTSERDSADYRTARKKDRALANIINEARERDGEITEKEGQRGTMIDDNNEERWSLGESRFRAATSRRRNNARSDSDTDINEESTVEATSSRPAPVKVVMRSNLTFNLGDEFFNWNQQNSDNEFEIPKSSNPSQAWNRGTDNDIQDTRDKVRDIYEKHRDMREKARDIRDKAREIHDKARDIYDKPRDMREKAGDIRDKAREIHDKAREIHDKPRDIYDKPRDMRDKARDTHDKARDIRDSHKPRDVTQTEHNVSKHLRERDTEERSSSSDSTSSE